MGRRCRRRRRRHLVPAFDYRHRAGGRGGGRGGRPFVAWHVPVGRQGVRGDHRRRAGRSDHRRGEQAGAGGGQGGAEGRKARRQGTRREREGHRPGGPGSRQGSQLTSPSPVASARRRQVVLRVLRSLGTTIALVALYYLLPLDHLASVPLAVILVVGLLVLLAVTGWELPAQRTPGPRRQGSLISKAHTLRQPVLHVIVFLALRCPAPGYLDRPVPLSALAAMPRNRPISPASASCPMVRLGQAADPVADELGGD